jgi:hypothetical protein
MAEWYSIVYKYLIFFFFTHPSIHGHLTVELTEAERKTVLTKDSGEYSEKGNGEKLGNRYNVS